jgi:hypothetical protein
MELGAIDRALRDGEADGMRAERDRQALEQSVWRSGAAARGAGQAQGDAGGGGQQLRADVSSVHQGRTQELEGAVQAQPASRARPVAGTQAIQLRGGAIVAQLATCLAAQTQDHMPVAPRRHLAQQLEQAVLLAVVWRVLDQVQHQRPFEAGRRRAGGTRL